MIDFDFDLIIIAGTRPEYLKLLSLFKELKKTDLKWCFVNTGQHKDLLKQVQNESWPQVNFTRINTELSLSISEILEHLQNE